MPPYHDLPPRPSDPIELCLYEQALALAYEGPDALGALHGWVDNAVEQSIIEGKFVVPAMRGESRILCGDALEALRTMPDDSVDCCITSPPYYGLRDYGVAGQIGLERTPEEFIARLVEVFGEVRRVLKASGTCWVVIGDSYNSSPPGNKNPMSKSGLHGAQTSATYRARLEETQQRQQEGRRLIKGLKPKDLIGIPWMLAFALRADGWWLRQDIIWAKPNPMPESAKDRCTKAHEYIFLLTKSAHYYFNAAAIAEPAVKGAAGSTFNSGKAAGHQLERSSNKPRVESGTRNARSVWTFATQPTPEAHFATFPMELPERCIAAGCPPGGLALDPFAGAGTTWLACIKGGRQFVGIELKQEYIDIATKRVDSLARQGRLL